MNRESRVFLGGLRRLRRGLALPALAALVGVGAFCSSNAWAQYTTLSGNVSTSSAGTSLSQSITDNPNASLSGLIAQDAIGNEASASGSLAAWDGWFSLDSHACSGGGPGFGGNANGSATCTVIQDYQVVSATLPAGTPVMIRINWAVSGQGTAAGNLTHHTSGAIGSVSGQVSITVGGVSIINVSGTRRREYNTTSGYYHYITGTLDTEEDSLTHNVTALVGQNIRIFMSGTASGNSSATLSSVTDGDSQMAMMWGISSVDPNASVVSLTYIDKPPPSPTNATLGNAVLHRPPRPPNLPQCFAFSNQPSATSACVSTNPDFSVSVAGTGPFSYEWHRNGVPVHAGVNPSASTATLVLPGVTVDQAGSYTVKVTNPCGIRTSEGAVLMVTSPPTISAHPGPVSISPPEMAPVSVAANGIGLEYQWQIETAPGVWEDLSSKSLDLPCGGTAVTDVDNESSVQIGISPCPGVNQYQVRAVVSNNCGSATSNEATITVGSPGGVPGNAAGATELLSMPTPNPTRGSTILAYTLSAPSPVRLEIFDAAGRLVRILVAGEQAAGWYQPVWQGTDESGRSVLSGIYFARLRTFQNGKPATSQRKINLVR
jgi:hypothetical protein